MKYLDFPIWCHESGMNSAMVRIGSEVVAMKNYLIILLMVLSAVTIFNGCAADDGAKSTSVNNGNNTNNGNVNIGGVQDIGVFRDIVNAGGIPGPDTLDANGFFSEHYIEYQTEDCGEDICLFGMLGRGVSVLSSDYMNVLQVGMKSQVNPQDYERPPTDFIAVIDVSGSMYSDNKLEYVRQGLHMMIDSLEPTDRLALVAYSDLAREAQELIYVDSAENRQIMHANVNRLVAGGSTNIYEALWLGFDIAAMSAAEGRYARVVFLSDGQPTAGITDPNSIIAFAREKATKTSQLTSIGVGTDVNYELMKELAMAGGNFYFIENSMALPDIFVEEVDYFSFPIAEDVHFTLSSGPDFYIGDTVGFENFTSSSAGGEATFPAIYLASRTSENIEDPNSRRGGGSAMFVRIVPQANTMSLSGILLTMSYTDPQTGETVGPQRVVVSDLSDGGMMPEGDFYSAASMRKSYAMLNIFLGLKEVCQRSSYYDFAMARELLISTIDYAYAVNAELADDDLTADIQLMETLLVNIESNGYYDYCGNGECYYYGDDVMMSPLGCTTSGSAPGTAALWFLAALAGFLFIRRRR